MTDTGIVADLRDRVAQIANPGAWWSSDPATEILKWPMQLQRDTGYQRANAILALLPATQASEGDVPRLRAALVEMGRMIPGCVLRDEVSTEFLMLLPEEMRVWKERALPTQASEGGLRERDWRKQRIGELIEEGGGWRACSGCQEGVDGCVSYKDYPYSDIFRCQPGSGCSECGGIGVLWEGPGYWDGYGDDVDPALQPPTPADSVAVPRYRHKKRGTVYEVVGTASLQIATGDLVDGSDLVVYRGDDGKLWAREESEFHDGRFEQLDAATPYHPTDTGLREFARAYVRAWEAGTGTVYLIDQARQALAALPEGER